MTAPAYQLPKRRVRGVLVVCASQDGFKTRAARLVEALHGRYSHVQGGYIVSELRAAKFARMYAQGFDASAISRNIISPR